MRSGTCVWFTEIDTPWLSLRDGYWYGLRYDAFCHLELFAVFRFVKQPASNV